MPWLANARLAAHLSAGEYSARCTKQLWFGNVSAETISTGDTPEERKQVYNPCCTVGLALQTSQQVR